MKPLVRGTETDLIEIPASWYLDDLPPMMFIKKAPNSHGFVNPRDIEDLWRDQFDWVYREMDYAVFPIAIHPDVAGRPQVLLMLERLYAHMIKHPGVRFITLGEMADDFARRHAVQGVSAPCAACAACSTAAAAGSMRRRRSIRPRCGASGCARVAIVRRVLAPVRVSGRRLGGRELRAARADRRDRDRRQPVRPLAQGGSRSASGGIDPLADMPLPPETSHDRPTCPLHVLTGFLGSGKTTLLNRMLRDPALADSAVLINEIGAVAIDHHLVERIETRRRHRHRRAEGRLHLLRLRGDLVAALRELYARRADGALPPFRRVVLETTGLADPAPVLFTLVGDPVLRHKFERGAVIATVDAVHGVGAARAASGMRASRSPSRTA